MIEKIVKRTMKELGGDSLRTVTLEEVTESINSYDRELFGDIMADVDVEEIETAYRSMSN